MKSGYLYCIIIMLVVLNSYLLFRLWPTLRYPQLNTSNSIESRLDMQNYINLLRGRIQLQAKNDDISIDESAVVMDTAGRNLMIKEIVKGKEKLVFFFTNNHCYSCVDGAIPYLEHLAGRIGYDRIFLLADLHERRDILTFKEKYKSKLSIYSIADSVLLGSAKSLNYPFLFKIDSTLKPHSFFLVEKDLSEITEDFMKETILEFKN